MRIEDVDMERLSQAGYSIRPLAGSELRRLGMNPNNHAFVIVPVVPPLSAEDAERILSEYDRMVRDNYYAGWNTIRAVYVNSTGEAAYEILEVADELGILNDANREDLPLRDAIWDLYDIYRSRIENDPLNVPSTNGEED